MKYYIVAGEPSGDIHGANLMKGILKRDPDAEFRFWGGDLMMEVGGEENLVKHYRETSFYGLWEVVKNLVEIMKQLDECKRDIKSYKPDAVILIDYPGFNLKIAKYSKKKGFRTLYYIAPKVWAWGAKRAKQIRRYVDHLYVIMPFERQYFDKKGIESTYEGCSVVDIVEEKRRDMVSKEQFYRENAIPRNMPIVALLAGSRRSEVRYNLPFMVELSRRFPEYQFVLGGVKWIEQRVYDPFIENSGVIFLCDQTYPLMAYAEAAVVTSGTASLELALMDTPQIVCYRRDSVFANIARMTVTVRFVSLVNLILGKESATELIQWDMKMPKAEKALTEILPNGERREGVLKDYKMLKKMVGEPGVGDRVGAKIVEFLEIKGE